MLNLSKEQLTKLTLHTAAINSLLVEAMLNGAEPEEQYGNDEPIGGEFEIDVFVVDARPENHEQEPEPLNLDAFCGDWTGGKRKPELTIFKAEPGYMAAWGKKPKNGGAQDCYLIEKVNGNLCFRLGNGYIYLSFDSEKDTIGLWPGGEYTRVATDKK